VEARQGYATKALALVLPEARAEGLDYVEITTDPTTWRRNESSKPTAAS